MKKILLTIFVVSIIAVETGCSPALPDEISNKNQSTKDNIEYQIKNKTVNETGNEVHTNIYLDLLPFEAHGKNVYVSYFTSYQLEGGKQPFTTPSGKVIDRGIGMWSDNGAYSGSGYAEYDISGKNVSTFEADICLQKQWFGTGYGTTIFIVYVDDKKIFSKELTISSTDIQHISIDIPKNTANLRLQVDQIAGVIGTHGAIWGDAKLH